MPRQYLSLADGRGRVPACRGRAGCARSLRNRTRRGSASWHVGQAPDHRAQKAADQRGIDISGQSARQIRSSDFASFDLLLAMDGSNYGELDQLAPKGERHKIRRFLDFAPHAGTKDVPDPFFGEAEGFDHALDLIDEAARGLLAELLRDETAPAKKGA